MPVPKPFDAIKKLYRGQLPRDSPQRAGWPLQQRIASLCSLGQASYAAPKLFTPKLVASELQVQYQTTVQQHCPTVIKGCGWTRFRTSGMREHFGPQLREETAFNSGAHVDPKGSAASTLLADPSSVIESEDQEHVMEACTVHRTERHSRSILSSPEMSVKLRDQMSNTTALAGGRNENTAMCAPWKTLHDRDEYRYLSSEPPSALQQLMSTHAVTVPDLRSLDDTRQLMLPHRCRLPLSGQCDLEASLRYAPWRLCTRRRNPAVHTTYGSLPVFKSLLIVPAQGSDLGSLYLDVFWRLLQYIKGSGPPCIDGILFHYSRPPPIQYLSPEHTHEHSDDSYAL
ncbi:hypothetical protein C8Q78DRAFT_991852 [Trametes maxima]|nr:hypothetical protein C8Q78DRAFT_991852 [Trametes maxima]